MSADRTLSARSAHAGRLLNARWVAHNGRATPSVINSPFVRAPARSDSARSRQDIAFHLHGPESGARCSRIADLGRWGGGAHDHLDAMNTGVSASCELYGQVTSRMRSNAAVRFGWLLAGARVTTVAAVRDVKDLLGP